MKKIDKNTNIIGIFEGTVEDLVRPFLTGGDLIRARRLAPMYIKYCKIFKIRADIAFAQGPCHECGKLTFKGIAKPEWNNFAGIGITGAGAKQTFASEDLGVLAHIAHLAWYVYPDHVHSLCSNKFDPRHFGTTHYKYNGDSTLKRLNNSWAVPGTTYADRIADYANIINSEVTQVPTPTPEPVEEILLQKGDKGDEVKKLQEYLTSIGYWLSADSDFGPKTEAGVKAFQKSKGLKENGFVDGELKALMNDFVVVLVPRKYQVIIQRGHIGRIKGATGTYREQEYTSKLGIAIGKLLTKTDLKYKIMDADNWEKPEPNEANIFLALHYDGSKNKNAKGYSLGFKPGTNEEFKEMLAINYGKLCKFSRRKDNYTTNMSKYYAWRDDLKRKPHVVGDNLVLIECGFGTNDIEREWMFANINDIAKCFVDTIIEYLKGK